MSSPYQPMEHPTDLHTRLYHLLPYLMDQLDIGAYTYLPCDTYIQHMKYMMDSLVVSKGRHLCPFTREEVRNDILLTEAYTALLSSEREVMHRLSEATGWGSSETYYELVRCYLEYRTQPITPLIYETSTTNNEISEFMNNASLDTE